MPMLAVVARYGTRSALAHGACVWDTVSKSASGKFHFKSRTKEEKRGEVDRKNEHGSLNLAPNTTRAHTHVFFFSSPPTCVSAPILSLKKEEAAKVLLLLSIVFLKIIV